MEPIQIDTDYLMLRIGRLTVNIEAVMSQRDSASTRAKQAEAQVHELSEKIADLEAELEAYRGNDD